MDLCCLLLLRLSLAFLLNFTLGFLKRKADRLPPWTEFLYAEVCSSLELITRNFSSIKMSSVSIILIHGQ